MSPSRRRVARNAASSADHEMRDQEVLRASKELAAYFKGRRTEREARAALKIIKAFIRDRERIDPSQRRPLPGAAITAAGTIRKPAATPFLKAPAARAHPHSDPNASSSRDPRLSGEQKSGRTGHD
jgi:hypothetical protein